MVRLRFEWENVGDEAEVQLSPIERVLQQFDDPPATRVNARYTGNGTAEIVIEFPSLTMSDLQVVRNSVRMAIMSYTPMGKNPDLTRLNIESS